MNKKERLALISNLVQTYDIETQEELVERLLNLGVQATQATVSRDMKTLGIVKVPSSANTYIYGLPDSLLKQLQPDFHHIKDCRIQDQFIHVSVDPGTTAVVKRHLLERFEEEIFSLVGDDDSLLLVLKTEVDGQTILAQIKEL